MTVAAEARPARVLAVRSEYDQASATPPDRGVSIEEAAMLDLARFDALCLCGGAADPAALGQLRRRARRDFVRVVDPGPVAGEVEINDVMKALHPGLLNGSRRLGRRLSARLTGAPADAQASIATVAVLRLARPTRGEWPTLAQRVTLRLLLEDLVAISPEHFAHLREVLQAGHAQDIFHALAIAHAIRVNPRRSPE